MTAYKNDHMHLFDRLLRTSLLETLLQNEIFLFLAAFLFQLISCFDGPKSHLVSSCSLKALWRLKFFSGGHSAAFTDTPCRRMSTLTQLSSVQHSHDSTPSSAHSFTISCAAMMRYIRLEAYQPRSSGRRPCHRSL